MSDAAAFPPSPPPPPPPGFSARFWGVRGSIPAPGAATARYGGNTVCVEVRCGDHVLVFDAGTGLRPLGQALQAQGVTEIDLFLSHTHLDHVLGWPFFAPAYDPRSRLRVWAGHLPDGETIERVVGTLMSPPFFPVPIAVVKAAASFHDFRCGETLAPAPGVTLRTAPLAHPGGACGYRVDFAGRSLCYVTDHEQVDGSASPALMALLDNADLLICDATYEAAEYPAHAGWGHSSWQAMCRLAAQARVRRLVLFHHDPDHDDDTLDRIAREAAAMRSGTLVAREGMVVTP